MKTERIKVLLVEDDQVDRMAFERFVKEEQLPYDYHMASSVEEGRRLLKSLRFDVVLTDYALGERTAFALFGDVHPDIPIIVVTGAGSEEIAVQAMKSGASNYLIKDLEYRYLKTLPVTVESAIKSKWSEKELRKYQEHLEEMVEARTAQLQQTNEQLSLEIHERWQAEFKLKNSMGKLREALEGTIQAIALIVETRDPYTAGHQKRVSFLAQAIAKEMRLSKKQIEAIRLAGFIHDLGKISTPGEILSKPGRISDLEFRLIKTHPQVGYEILKGIKFPYPIAQIVRQHHERMDGSGYPQGLAGEQIMIEARILGVADVVEAMATHRPYRPSLGLEKALEEITRHRNILYDPHVVDACLKLFREKGFNFEAIKMQGIQETLIGIDEAAAEEGSVGRQAH